MVFTLKKGRWISLLVGALSFSYIAYRLLHYQHQFSQSDIPHFKTSNLLLAAAAQVTLLCANVIIESKKWQLLVSSVKIVGFGEATKMVLAGFASGIVTPAKLGEPVGRALFLKKELWAQATLLTYLGGTISNIVVIGVAILCMPAIYNVSGLRLPFIPPLYLFVLLCILAVCLLLWHKKQWLKKNINRFKALQTIKELFYQIASTPIYIISRVFAYSFLRFAVYCFQLSIMLWLMGAHITAHSLMLIPIYFFLVSIAPTFFLAELGIRGSVALFVFTGLCMSDVSIVLAVSALWTLNQVVPALFGIIIMWRNGILKNNNAHIPN